MHTFPWSVIFSIVVSELFIAESTIIIVEDAKACFRRVLAGKRVSHTFIKRALICETVEECQRECSDEKRFVCEGFNYRLDPAGRGKGDCELLSIPITRLDFGRDIIPDPDYDYYERDRNANSNCRPRYGGNRFGGGYDNYGGSGYGDYGSSGGYNDYRGGGSGGGGGGYYADRRYDYKGDRPGASYGSSLKRPGDLWPEDDTYRRRPYRPESDRRYDYPSRKPYDDDYRYNSNRRGDYSYHSHHTQDHFYQDRFDEEKHIGNHYLPTHTNKPDPYDPNLPTKFYERPKGDNWGYGDRYGTHGTSYGPNVIKIDIDRNHDYLPPKVDAPKGWGLYDNSYGNGYHRYGSYDNKQTHTYSWNSNKYDDNSGWYGVSNPQGDNYLPLPKPVSLHKPFSSSGDSYLPVDKLPVSGSYLPLQNHDDHYENSIIPAEPRRPFNYNFLKDECSLRMATGFKLHKGIVRKSYPVPNIYECELLCFKEKEFPCASYAFRYSISIAAPTDNCYISVKNYKELDNYSDLEPDRDFDVYTMNNRGRCEETYTVRGRDISDCFWRVRSGQRLDSKVVRDSLTTKSVVECEVECLKSKRFTCRAFSYRYGSQVIGGVIDNCQLTDWPFYELDPRHHFVPESGFEVYDRGSYGHGCEPHHFGIRGHQVKIKVTKADQLCYIGFGSPFRLLPQATKKALYVSTELDCKRECSKAREETLFQCMSFSYRTRGPKSEPNCLLSDIYQRDLLPHLDYVHDPDCWLFAWDNYNPQCIAIAQEPISDNNIGGHYGFNDRYDNVYSLDTWRVYSVSGWPCRRGSLCQENREAGFWYCELEGGDKNTWDYCCRPDHQCGSSYGYPYQWCYVGPGKTQWRKCSDRYFPYIHNIIDRLDHDKPYGSSPSRPWLTDDPYRPGGRPDRPPAPPLKPPPSPSLNEYEAQFDEEFLAPPKPGGFGQPRRWPVSYLHKEMPPNTTDSDSRLMRIEQQNNPKYAAIQNLINVIKKNDLSDIQYHISNESNKDSDILFVKIPLPTNFSQEIKETKENSLSSNTTVHLERRISRQNSLRKRSHKSLPFVTGRHTEDDIKEEETHEFSRSPTYRRGFITRTNITSYPRFSI